MPECSLSVILLGETSFQARKYKTNHSHSTDTLSVVVCVQQNVKIQIQ